VTAPVDFVQCLRTCVGLGTKRIIDMGTKGVTGALLKRIDKNVEVM
jgi:malonyl CoA-acyl carrier protein transacylase